MLAMVLSCWFHLGPCWPSVLSFCCHCVVILVHWRIAMLLSWCCHVGACWSLCCHVLSCCCHVGALDDCHVVGIVLRICINIGHVVVILLWLCCLCGALDDLSCVLSLCCHFG